MNYMTEYSICENGKHTSEYGLFHIPLCLMELKLRYLKCPRISLLWNKFEPFTMHCAAFENHISLPIQLHFRWIKMKAIVCLFHIKHVTYPFIHKSSIYIYNVNSLNAMLRLTGSILLLGCFRN